MSQKAVTDLRLRDPRAGSSAITRPGNTQIIIRELQSAGASMTSVYMDEAVVTGGDFDGNGGRQLPLELYDIDRVPPTRGYPIWSRRRPVRRIATNSFGMSV